MERIGGLRVTFILIFALIFGGNLAFADGKGTSSGSKSAQTLKEVPDRIEDLDKLSVPKLERMVGIDRYQGDADDNDKLREKSELNTKAERVPFRELSSRQQRIIINNLPDQEFKIGPDPKVCKLSKFKTKPVSKIFNPVEKILSKSLCLADSERAKIRLNKGKTSASYFEAKLYLLSFQDPDEIELPEDYPIIKALVNSAFVIQEPDLMVGLLRSVFLNSVGVYLKLIDENPNLIKLKRPFGSNFSCLSKSQEKNIGKGVTNALGEYIDVNLKIEKHKWRGQLRKLKPVIMSLSADERGGLAKVTTRKVITVIEDDDLSETYYKFAKQTVNRYFGKLRTELTDVISDPKRDKVVIVSTKPIKGGKRVPNHMYYVKETGLSLKRLFTKKRNRTITWKTNGKTYKANLKVKKPVNTLFTHEKPDYDSMWKDNELNGMHFVSPNVGFEYRQKSIKKFKKFYEGLGFKFEKPVVVDQFKSYVAEAFKERLDYFRREGHNMQNRDFLNVDAKVEVWKATRIRSDGRKDNIELVYPLDEQPKLQVVSTGDLQKWMKERKDKGNGQLIYHAGSCVSTHRMKKILPHVASKLFVPIASSSNVKISVYNIDKSTSALIKGFLKGETYKKIKEKLKKLPQFIVKAKHKIDINQYVLPHEKKYLEQHSKYLITQAKVFENGKAYSAERVYHGLNDSVSY